MTHTPVYSPALTHRELDVLDLKGTWLTLAEIGTKLGISENTVKTHARAVNWKLGVSSRRDAVDWSHQANRGE